MVAAVAVARFVEEAGNHDHDGSPKVVSVDDESHVHSLQSRFFTDLAYS